ncbi:hypothetical protein HPY655_05495 [Helicobacter pylori]|nr:hypothetical protein HPY655_05495 [Helicobacter pylori]
MALTAFKTILRAIDMKILSKIKTTTRRNKPCQKDKNIERPIIAEFKTNFYQGVFYGFSK